MSTKKIWIFHHFSYVFNLIQLKIWRTLVCYEFYRHRENASTNTSYKALVMIIWMKLTSNGVIISINLWDTTMIITQVSIYDHTNLFSSPCTFLVISIPVVYSYHFISYGIEQLHYFRLYGIFWVFLVFHWLSPHNTCIINYPKNNAIKESLMFCTWFPSWS